MDHPAPTPPLALTIPQTAAALGVSTRHVYNLIRSSGLPVVRLGTKMRVPTQALQGWLADGAGA